MLSALIQIVLVTRTKKQVKFNTYTAQKKAQEEEYLLGGDFTTKNKKFNWKIAISFFFSVISLIYFGLIFTQAATCSVNFQRMKMPGNLVEFLSIAPGEPAKSVKFHLKCEGDHNNKSTIIFENGMGESLIYLIPLQNLLVKA